MVLRVGCFGLTGKVCQIQGYFQDVKNAWGFFVIV